MKIPELYALCVQQERFWADKDMDAHVVLVLGNRIHGNTRQMRLDGKRGPLGTVVGAGAGGLAPRVMYKATEVKEYLKKAAPEFKAEFEALDAAP